MAKIVFRYNIPPSIKLRLGYREAGTSFPFIYMSKYLTFDDSPYTIDNLPDGHYEIEYTQVACGNKPCGNPQVINIQAGDPNSIHGEIEMGVDGNSNVYFSITLSETLSSSITISGQYVISGQKYNYSVIIPKDVIAYNKVINTTSFDRVDSFCYSSINPNIVNNKTIVIDNGKKC